MVYFNKIEIKNFSHKYILILLIESLIKSKKKFNFIYILNFYFKDEYLIYKIATNTPFINHKYN